MERCAGADFASAAQADDVAVRGQRATLQFDASLLDCATPRVEMVAHLASPRRCELNPLAFVETRASDGARTPDTPAVAQLAFPAEVSVSTWPVVPVVAGRIVPPSVADVA